VFHLAQPYDIGESDPESIIRPSVIGTENVFGAMKDAGLKRVVYAGSCAAVGVTDDPDEPLDETCWREEGAIPYTTAKILGERRAMELAGEHGLDVVVTLPVGVLGGWDFKPTPTMQPAYDAINGKGPMPMAVNHTDVRDVAASHRLAWEKGTPGERYLVGAEALLPEAAAAVVGNITGKAPAHKWPPYGLLSFLATVLGWFGIAPITKTALDDVYGKHFVYDCSKARRELGYAPAPPRVAIEEAMRWGAFVGALKPKVAAKVAAALPPDPTWDGAVG